MTDREAKLVVSCRCDRVAIEAAGAPILAAACYCNSCQRAGRLLQEMPDAPPVVGADGGTEYVLYRKDRVRLLRGAELLEEHRLTPESPTRRVRAACCRSPMFLDMTKGHWLSLYRSGLRANAPPLEMRVMTNARPAGVELAADIPNHGGLSAKFMWRLLGARIAMGLRAPKMEY
jgi:hypothetical protein